MEFVYSPPSCFLARIVLDLANLDIGGSQPRKVRDSNQNGGKII
jgi:hypothetical protein